MSCDIHAAGGSMGQRMRDAGAVTDDIQPLMPRLQVAVDVNLHVIKFDLDTVEQRVCIGSAGCDLIQRIDHLNDAVEDTLRDNQREVAGRCGKSRYDKAFSDPGGIAAPSADQIAESLHHDTAAEHIGEPRNAFTVAVGILKRF